MKLKRLKTWTWLEVFIIPVVIHVKFSAAVHILHRNCVYQPQAVLMIWFLKDSFSVAQTSPQSILKYYMQNRILHRIYKNVKWSRYRHGVAQRVGRGIALLFHDRGTRRVWVVSSTPRPHFTPGKDPVPILQEAGWIPGPVWTGEKSRPHRDSIPDCPAHSQYIEFKTHQALYHWQRYIYIYIYIYLHLPVVVFDEFWKVHTWLWTIVALLEYYPGICLRHCEKQFKSSVVGS